MGVVKVNQTDNVGPIIHLHQEWLSERVIRLESDFLLHMFVSGDRDGFRRLSFALVNLASMDKSLPLKKFITSYNPKLCTMEMDRLSTSKEKRFLHMNWIFRLGPKTFEKAGYYPTIPPYDSSVLNQLLSSAQAVVGDIERPAKEFVALSPMPPEDSDIQVGV